MAKESRRSGLTNQCLRKEVNAEPPGQELRNPSRDSDKLIVEPERRDIAGLGVTSPSCGANILIMVAKAHELSPPSREQRFRQPVPVSSRTRTDLRPKILAHHAYHSEAPRC
jgi:hypothetical protein